jgi:hypothetical protein
MDGRVNDCGFPNLPDGWRRIELAREEPHELCGNCIDELEELFAKNTDIQVRRMHGQRR